MITLTISEKSLILLSTLIAQAIEEELNFPTHEDPEWMNTMLELQHTISSKT